ncbi:putative bifunctional diguanylate cyclase/phosphodiesterase [Mangrovibacillus cuniculi]|nr:bifunctional diguanylate cyclase/phosphodiesterase [Mangrovibacillus cuniculi]
MDMTTWSLKKWIAFGLLLVLTFFASLLTIELLPGVHFIFTTIILFIILYYFGVIPALITALISGVHLFYLWDSIFGTLSLFLEIFIVGTLYTYIRRNLVFWDILYNLTLGAMISFVFSFYFLSYGPVDSVLIMLKQTVNMIVNILLANFLIILIESIRSKQVNKPVSLFEILFTLFSLFFLVPLIVFLIHTGKNEMKQVQETMNMEIEYASNTSNLQITKFQSQHVTPLSKLANFLQDNNNKQLDVQREFMIVQQSFPEFQLVYAVDSKNKKIAHHARNAFKFYDTNAYQFNSNTQLERPEYISNLFNSQVNSKDRKFISIAYPFWHQNLSGKVIGIIKPVEYLQILHQSTKGTNAESVIIDELGKVIASTTNQFRTGDTYVVSKNTLQKSEIFLTNQRISSLQQLSTISYVEEKTLGENYPWKVATIVSMSDYNTQLYNTYIQLLVVALFSTFLAVVLSFFISNWLQKELNNVLLLTNNLTENITSNEKIDWPHSLIKEIFYLIAAFKQSEIKLKKLFQENIATKLDLQYLAHYDPLTNVYNRNYIMKNINELIEHSPNSVNFSVLFIDLDRFKIVNDTVGHRIGDKLLVEVAERLREINDNNLLISRIGGDEFIVVVPSYDEVDSLSKIANEIIESLNQSYHVEGNEFHLSASIGISVYPDDGKDVHTLIKNADIAMYAAKDNGKNTYEFYNSSYNSVTSKVEMENELRHAIERKELQLFYQPKVNIASGEIVGAEALIRWIHPTYGFVSPADFIPIAEETGLIIPMGEWILEQACKDLFIWNTNRTKNISVSVNISMHQFLNENLLKSVENAINLAKIDPTLLELEITESVAMFQPEIVIEKLKNLKNKGITLALDDFGTGYSSLNYLKMLPIDVLKIDQSFIKDMDHADTTIVRSLIEIAHSLHMTVVAEGVETKSQLNYLQGVHCDLFQGYYFSKAIPQEEFLKLLRIFK